MSESKKIDYIQEKVDSVANTVANIDKDMAIQKATFEAHTAQDEKMYDELRRMNDILQQNTDSLKAHMQNNILLKDMIVNMNKRLEPIEIEFIQKAAVRTYVIHKIKLISKIAAAVAAVGAASVYVGPWLAHLLHLI
jgi:hypothetical protein